MLRVCPPRSNKRSLLPPGGPASALFFREAALIQIVPGAELGDTVPETTGIVKKKAPLPCSHCPVNMLLSFTDKLAGRIESAPKRLNKVSEGTAKPIVGKLRSEIAKVGLKFERTLSPLVFENDRNKHPQRQNPSPALETRKQNTRKEG